METKKPEVHLFSMTENPLQTIALGIDIWHHDVPNHPGFKTEDGYLDAPAGYTDKECAEKISWLFKQPHQTPFEYVNLVWIIRNASRAFQQQLTRHRIGFSYSIQSLRVVEVGKFADEGRYTMPSDVKNKSNYHGLMVDLQYEYNHMIANGEKAENARGILPLNVHSPITMACTYRSLLGLLRQRMCVATQEEWRGVVEGMRRELYNRYPVLAEPFDCMCQRFKNGKGQCKTLHRPVTSDE